MSYGIYLSRSALAGLVLGLLGASAHAQFSGGPVPGVEPKKEHYGLGFGRMVMPNHGSVGLMTGILVDDDEDRRYALGAELTTIFAGDPVPGQYFAFGKMSGTLVEIEESGPFYDAEPELEAYVEGTWRLEKSLSGTYQAFIYQKSKAGALELSGVIHGKFHVAPAGNLLNDVIPGKPALDDAAGQRPAFGDASSAKKSSGSTVTNPPLIGAFKARFKLLD